MRDIDQDAEAGRLVSLLVQDDDSAPRYRDGDRLLCEPKAKAELGEDIVVIVKDGGIRVGRLAALAPETVTIEFGLAPVAIPRTDVGAIWPVRLMAPGRTTMSPASRLH
jgi:hypothetical protein